MKRCQCINYAKGRGGEREIEGETELAKVAEGSHSALSLARFIALALLLSPSLTLFADHHHRHTINSVCVCVRVCVRQSVSNWLMQLISELTSPQIHQLCFFFPRCLYLFLFVSLYQRPRTGKAKQLAKYLFMHIVFVFVLVVLKEGVHCNCRGISVSHDIENASMTQPIRFGFSFSLR